MGAFANNGACWRWSSYCARRSPFLSSGEEQGCPLPLGIGGNFMHCVRPLVRPPIAERYPLPAQLGDLGATQTEPTLKGNILRTAGPVEYSLLWCTTPRPMCQRGVNFGPASPWLGTGDSLRTEVFSATAWRGRGELGGDEGPGPTSSCPHPQPSQGQAGGPVGVRSMHSGIAALTPVVSG